MTAPPAQGVRVAWDAIPEAVRAGIERICGAPVVQARSQPAGFSPGLAARVLCADGSRHFVKAVSAHVNPDTPAMHRREAQVLRDIDPLIVAGGLPAPRLKGTLDLGPWTALVLDDVDGRHPELPWQDDDLRRVLEAVDLLADVLTPTPISGPALVDRHAELATGWRLLAEADDRRIGAWPREHLDELVRLERQWAEHAAGDTLLHADLRADNILLTSDRVVVVDWPHASVGAAFLDTIFLAPSVAMQGGPPPHELVTMTRAGRAADRGALTAMVCVVAGYFTERSLRPPPPGIPTVRAFQAAQGEIARQWLAELL